MLVAVSPTSEPSYFLFPPLFLILTWLWLSLLALANSQRPSLTLKYTCNAWPSLLAPLCSLLSKFLEIYLHIIFIVSLVLLKCKLLAGS